MKKFILIFLLILPNCFINYLFAQDCSFLKPIKNLIVKEMAEFREQNIEINILFIERFTINGNIYLIINPSMYYWTSMIGCICYYEDMMIVYIDYDSDIIVRNNDDNLIIPKEYNKADEFYDPPNLQRYYIFEDCQYKRIKEDSHFDRITRSIFYKRFPDLAPPPPPSEP